MSSFTSIARTVDRTPHSSQFKVPQWLGVLSTCTKYVIQDGIDAAVKYLNDPPEGPFKPAFKLRLAWQFRIREWFDSCITELLTHPWDELSPSDYSDLGSDIVYAIVATHKRCLRHRSGLIPYLPEVVHSDECTDRGNCNKNWTLAFSSAMLFYTNTRKYYTGREVYERFVAANIPNLNPRCRDLTLTRIQETGVLWKEEHFIQKALANIKERLESTNPPHPRPPPRYLSSFSHNLTSE